MKHVSLSIFRITLIGILICLSQPVVGGTTTSYVEDFSTTAYRDGANTTATWDTGSGKLRLEPFSGISQVGGYSTSGMAIHAAIAGDLALVAETADGMTLLDISDPANPTYLGWFDTPGHPTYSVIEGRYAYIAAEDGDLQIADISDPTVPVLVGSLSTPGSMYSVAVDGDLLYVASDDLLIYDLSDPVSPTLLGTYVTPGVATDVEVRGNQVYVTDGADGLLIIDVTTVSTPTLVGQCSVPDYAKRLEVNGIYAYIASSAGGMNIVSILDPANPAVVGNVPTTDWARDLKVVDDFVYLAADDDGFLVIDVSNAAAPAVIETLPSFYTQGVAISGEHAFVACRTSGLKVMDICDLASLHSQAGLQFTDFSNSIVVEGQYAYVPVAHEAVRILDIRDPVLPHQVGSYPISGIGDDIDVHGDLGFLVDTVGGFQIIDLSTKSIPVQLAQYNPVSSVRSVEIAGDIAFLGTYTNLEMLDISDPTTPALVGSYSTPAAVYDIAAIGNTLLLGLEGGDIVSLDITDPAVPVFLDSYSPAEGSYPDIAVSGTNAYIANGTNLLVLGFSDPGNLTLVGSYTYGSMLSVDVQGDYAFVGWLTLGYEGLLVLDITDPTNPQFISSSEEQRYIRDLTVVGDYAYTAESDKMAVVSVFFRTYDHSRNIGQSLELDESDVNIAKARVNAVVVNNVNWELSADNGVSWQSYTADGSWSSFGIPGPDLLWRGTLLTHSPRNNSTCSRLDIDWLYECAAIKSIADIPGDQGRQVRLQWLRSAHDFMGEPDQIVEYSLYRRFDGTGIKSATPELPEDLSSIARSHATAAAEAGWDYVATVPVRVQDMYSVVVPTLADSTISDGQHWSTFMVSALTATPGLFFDSPPDSGYSLDNLAPSAPAGAAMDGALVLTWGDPPEPDFQYFTVYGSESGLMDGTEVVIGYTTGTEFDAAADPHPFFLLTATDFAGNEGDPAVLENEVSGVGDLPVVRTTLLGNHPNPFNPGTVIAYELAGTQTVSLTIFDVAGRTVRRLLDGVIQPAGHRETTWRGTDDTGARVASGAYFYHLEAGPYSETKRMMLIK